MTTPNIPSTPGSPDDARLNESTAGEDVVEFGEQTLEFFASPFAAGFDLPDKTPSIVARNVDHFFGDGDTQKQVLYDVNLELNPGEIVIMTGPSGSGKTTILTLIGALRSVQHGSLTLNGEELKGMSRPDLVRIRRSIGFIFQAHNLFDAYTAVQNVGLALELGDTPAHEMHDKAVAILTRLGLGHRLGNKPAQLSGGQRQRVAIARAVVNRPKIILADEPTAALDKESGREVVKLLRERADQDGATILIVTHDNRILDVADRIVNMVDGRVSSNVNIPETNAICAFLKKCSVFEAMSPQALLEISQKMKRERFRAGTKVIQQGEQGDKFYLVRQGRLNVLAEKTDGSASKIAEVQKGGFFGEAALLTGAPRGASVVAQGPCELYSLGKSDFTAAVEQSPAFRQQLVSVALAR